MLLEAGADASIQNNNGHTAADCVRINMLHVQNHDLFNQMQSLFNYIKSHEVD